MPSSRFANANPLAAQSPCPREPVATLTHGLFGVGCPSSVLLIFRRVIGSSSIAPASERAAQRIGAAWPLERIKLSTLRALGLPGSQRISWKKSAETISAQDIQEVGWPDP